MKKILPRLISVIAFILLSSCSFNPFISNNRTTGNPGGALIGAGAAGGATALLGAPKPVIAAASITGGMVGYYVTTLRHDAGGIINSGGKVYRVGDFVGIYIPTDKLFEPNTAEFLPQAEPILASTADVLARYPNNSILISGNTSGFSRPKWEVRLSEARARKVSAYLWNAGINQFKYQSNDLRKLTYVGYGDYFPISQTYTNDGIRENSRIQITSYPSDCDLLLDRKHLAMRNMGGLEDDFKDYKGDCGTSSC